ncbi:23S rRNA (adenine(1618)-N(6))-methyltransferase RlmF [Salibacteraceae bacterium]|nr:23S rRNA (adenine(1618)-N(6))-methyltransferase RlmF [Salibacteraceae bacterium]
MPRPRIKPVAAVEAPKPKIHPRNKHQDRYDLELLSEVNDALKPHVQTNEHGIESIDFFNPEAVKALNQALLKQFYGIKFWDIPDGYLVPPIPGRADYIHYAADLMSGNYPKRTTDPIPLGTQIKCLDIGVGANCVYPIIGKKVFGWDFVGSDIDEKAIAAAQKIIDQNELGDSISLRKQSNGEFMFRGIVKDSEYFDLCICNPPFHASEAEAKAASSRKIRNLKGQTDAEPTQNFGGQHSELWCEGGELQFIHNYMRESKEFAENVLWFTTLVSKKENVGKVLRQLDKLEALNVQVIEMGQGMKQSRIIGWTFRNRKARKTWHRTRWDVQAE